MSVFAVPPRPRIPPAAVILRSVFPDAGIAHTGWEHSDYPPAATLFGVKGTKVVRLTVPYHKLTVQQAHMIRRTVMAIEGIDG